MKETEDDANKWDTRLETAWLGMRMLLKTIAAMGWLVVFSVLYSRIWSKRWGSEKMEIRAFWGF